MIEAVCKRINAGRATTEVGSPPLVGGIVVAADREPSSKVSMILFDADGHAAAVAKVARSPSGEASLRAEAAALNHFRSLGCQTVQSQTPEPILIERIAGRLVFAMTALQGSPMTTRYYTPRHTRSPARVQGDFMAAGTWLKRFHRETFSDVEPLDTTMFERRIVPIFERYRREVAWGPVEDQLLDDIAHRTRRLRGGLVPITGIHGDFWMGNVLVSGNQVQGVVDWERSVPAGVPLVDLYKFPTSYGFYLDRATSRRDGSVPGHPGRTEHLTRWRECGNWPNLAGFGYTYFGSGWFPERVRRFVMDHLAAFGIPPGANGIFFPMFLAEQALALDVPEFREGYRAALLAFAAHRSSTWVWTQSGASQATRGGARVG